MERGKLFALLKLLAFLFLIVTAVYFFRFTETGRSITPEAVLNRIRSYKPYDVLIYIGIYIVGTVVMIPGTALSFAGAVLYGTLLGTLYTWIGAVIGSSLAYFVARLLGRDFVDRLLQGRLAEFDRQVSEKGFDGLLIIRLLPIFPFNGVNFASGLTSIKFKDYVLATAIGILPGTFMFQYLFATVGQRLLTDGWKWSYLGDPYLWAPIFSFIVFILVVRFATRKFAKKPSQDDAEVREREKLDSPGELPRTTDDSANPDQG
ncbi:TVP38/TMEM64 family inner membrane protein YdjZ [Planctomycetes bacterium Pan216]|uniref:TVP38/TMEM64 family membrane protein n=1 Tax=Kolteria novifilia TaxID=2527975 RepID=A0A518B6U7_9BACT|nr:TVP38/TMEM64 family inner membrane protein YdjZ [Planctomycetes bacterium Pan216]